MKLHAGRSIWAGPVFDGKTANDFLTRLNRLAGNAPDQATRKGFEGLADQMAGYQLRFLLPYGPGRKLVMVCLLSCGLYAIASGHFSGWLLIASSLTFSPRIVGEMAMILGKLTGQPGKMR